MVGLRLFMPESWTSDAARLDRAEVPEELRPYRTKPEIALAEIDRVRAAGVRVGCVLADAGYGLFAPYHQGLSELGLTWAIGIPFKQKAYPVDVSMVFPVATRGRPRKNAIPDITSISVQATLDMQPPRRAHRFIAPLTAAVIAAFGRLAWLIYADYAASEPPPLVDRGARHRGVAYRYSITCGGAAFIGGH